MLSAAKHTEWSVIQVFYLMIHMHIQGYGTHASGVLNRVESSSNIWWKKLAYRKQRCAQQSWKIDLYTLDLKYIELEISTRCIWYCDNCFRTRCIYQAYLYKRVTCDGRVPVLPLRLCPLLSNLPLAVSFIFKNPAASKAYRLEQQERDSHSFAAQNIHSITLRMWSEANLHC